MLPDEGDAADDGGGDCEDEGMEAGDVVVSVCWSVCCYALVVEGIVVVLSGDGHHWAMLKELGFPFCVGIATATAMYGKE